MVTTAARASSGRISKAKAQSQIIARAPGRGRARRALSSAAHADGEHQRRCAR